MGRGGTSDEPKGNEWKPVGTVGGARRLGNVATARNGTRSSATCIPFHTAISMDDLEQRTNSPSDQSITSASPSSTKEASRGKAKENRDHIQAAKRRKMRRIPIRPPCWCWSKWRPTAAKTEEKKKSNGTDESVPRP